MKQDGIAVLNCQVVSNKPTIPYFIIQALQRPALKDDKI